MCRYQFFNLRKTLPIYNEKNIKNVLITSYYFGILKNRNDSNVIVTLFQQEKREVTKTVLCIILLTIQNKKIQYEKLY